MYVVGCITGGAIVFVSGLCYWVTQRGKVYGYTPDRVEDDVHAGV